MFIKKRKAIQQPEYHTGNVTFLHKGKLLEGRIFGKEYRSNAIMFSEVLYDILSGEVIYEGIPHHAIESRS